MVYAAKINSTDAGLTIGGINGALLNDVYAFEKKSDLNKARMIVFPKGYSLVQLSRKEIEKFYGRNFEILNDGLVNYEGYSSQFTVNELEEMRPFWL